MLPTYRHIAFVSQGMVVTFYCVTGDGSKVSSDINCVIVSLRQVMTVCSCLIWGGSEFVLLFHWGW